VIVYDNTSTFLDNWFPQMLDGYTASAEAGDEIHLGGTARTITSITVILYDAGTALGGFDAQVRFLRNDGQGETPGSEIYSTGYVQGFTSQPGLNSYTFTIPHVVVPDRFTWTIMFDNRYGGNGDFGPAYYDPPTVGSSGDWLWFSQSGEGYWNPYAWGADPVANFGARLEAVPEPASCAALALGLAAFARRRRCQRKPKLCSRSG
jgi:hypothetical protein